MLGEGSGEDVFGEEEVSFVERTGSGAGTLEELGEGVGVDVALRCVGEAEGARDRLEGVGGGFARGRGRRGSRGRGRGGCRIGGESGRGSEIRSGEV